MILRRPLATRAPPSPNTHTHTPQKPSAVERKPVCWATGGLFTSRCVGLRPALTALPAWHRSAELPFRPNDGVCVKAITTSAPRDHSCLASELSDREKTIKSRLRVCVWGSGGGVTKISALRPNFADIVPRLIAKIPPSLLPSPVALLRGAPR